ncbi:MAG: tetratricopeptide repeat protein [Deltaproteobacteria bacterium]|nr:tetratricopeptide repeat protein [Deltaproteobacteria bacterium]
MKNVIGQAILLLLLLLIGSNVGAANPMSSIVSEAHERYRSGNFADAERLYREAIRGGIRNGHILYNLGNAQYRLGKIGEALANLRRAAVLLPRDGDVAANLQLIRSRVGGADDVKTEHSEFFALHRALAPREQVIVLLVLSTVFWAAVYMALTTRRAGWRMSSVCFGLLAAYVAMSVFGTRVNARQEIEFVCVTDAQDVGVIVSNQARARSGDSDSFEAIGILPEGSELDVGERRGEWVQVFLAEGRRGWVKEEDIAVIGGV